MTNEYDDNDLAPEFQEALAKNVQQKYEVKKAYMEQQKANLIKYQLDTNDIIEEIRLNLLGLRFNRTKKRYDKIGIPLMNSAGANTFITLIRPEVNKIKILSTFDAERVNHICEEFEHNIVDVLYQKYDQYGIDKKLLSSLRALCGNAVLSTYLRGKDALTLEFLKVSEKVLQTTTERPQEKKGFFGLFRGAPN